MLEDWIDENGSIDLHKMPDFQEMLKLDQTMAMTVVSDILRKYVGQVNDSLTMEMIKQEIIQAKKKLQTTVNQYKNQLNYQYGPLGSSFGYTMPDIRNQTLLDYVPESIYDFKLDRFNVTTSYAKTYPLNGGMSTGSSKHSSIELHRQTIQHGPDADHKKTFLLKKVVLHPTTFDCYYSDKTTFATTEMSYFTSDARFKELYTYLISIIEDTYQLSMFDIMDQINFKPLI